MLGQLRTNVRVYPDFAEYIVLPVSIPQRVAQHAHEWDLLGRSLDAGFGFSGRRGCFSTGDNSTPDREKFASASERGSFDAKSRLIYLMFRLLFLRQPNLDIKTQSEETQQQCGERLERPRRKGEKRSISCRSFLKAFVSVFQSSPLKSGIRAYQLSNTGRDAPHPFDASHPVKPLVSLSVNPLPTFNTTERLARKELSKLTVRTRKLVRLRFNNP